MNTPVLYAPSSLPVISGEANPCISSNYVYSTQMYSPPYDWIISGTPTVDYTITGGGGPTDNSINITWHTVGAQSVSVTYIGATGYGTLPIMVQQTFPVSVVVTPSANYICSGTPVTFTATPVNGGPTPFFNWFVNGQNVGSGSSNYTYIPANGDYIHCEVTSSLACPPVNFASSPPVTMIVVSNFPVGVTVVASQNPQCEGLPVTFTAEAFNGGNSPLYQWFLNGDQLPGATDSTYAYVPTNDDIITCRLTSSLACVSGNPATATPVTMTMSPIQPVSVTISPSANPVCAGSLVTCTAVPVNGGTQPFYTWSVNGTNIGLNGATMDYVPVNDDIVTCVLMSNAQCQTGNPATSLPLNMSVQQFAPVSVSIEASATNICSGYQVTFTATPANGGSSPDYQWYVNDVPVTWDTNAVFIYTPTNGDQVRCNLTSSLLCGTGSPAISNSISLTVSPSILPSVSVTASSNPSCAGTPITFTASPLNAGSGPTFQWIVNGLSIPLATNSTYIYAPNNNDIVVCQVTSNSLCTQGVNVLSTPIPMSVSASIPISIAINVSQDTVCEGGSVVFTAVHPYFGVPGYQWKVNGLPVGPNSETFTYTPFDGDVITCVLSSGLSCATGNPATSNAITMHVAGSIPVSVSITASANPACTGQPVTFSTTIVNGGLNPDYQWYVNGIPTGPNTPDFTYTPMNGDFFQCIMTSGFSCASGNPASSNIITISVGPNIPVGVVISSSQNPTCQGSQVTYTAIPTQGGSAPVFHWKKNGIDVGSNGPVYAYIPVNGDIITCELVSSISCPLISPVVSNQITQSVLQIVNAGVSISASSNPVCPLYQVTYTAAAINQGPSPTYQWKLNGNPAGSNGNTFQYTPVNNDKITCQVTSSLQCVSGNPATSNQILMGVNSTFPASITISASANPFCQGANVTFVAALANQGSAPVYQWLKNGVAQTGSTNSSFTYAPDDGDFVSCQGTSSLSCAQPKPVTSFPIHMVRNNGAPASVLITVSENPVCAGSTVTFHAAPTNGGTSPQYQWYVNGAPAGVNNATFVHTVSGGETVTCKLTSNLYCASGSPTLSNAIILGTIAAPTATISIAASTNPCCPNSTVSFSSIITNGGSSPGYQWKVNGINGGTGSTYSYVPEDNDVVTCTLTSSAACINGVEVISDPLNMVVTSPLPLAITVTATSDHVCQGTTVIYTAVPVNAGLTPSYQWTVNTTNTGTNNATFIYPPANGDQVACRVTTSMVCATPAQKLSDPLMMTVDPSPPAGLSISASANPVCQATSVTLTAINQVNQGNSPTYQWRVNGFPGPGATNPTFTYIPQNGDVVTVTMTSNASCVSGNPAIANYGPIMVTSPLTVGASIAASDNPFCAGNTVIFTPTVTNGGTPPGYQWFVNGVNSGATGSTFSYIPAGGDQVSCLVTSSQYCVINNPAPSNTITMTQMVGVLPAGVTITSDKNNFCPGAQVRFDAVVSNGGTNPHYSWSVNGIHVGNNLSYYMTMDIANGDQVTCQIISNLACANPNTATSNTLVMSVLPSAPVSVSITGSCNSCCVGTSVSYTAVAVNQGLDPIYRWFKNGTYITGLNSPVYTYVPLNGDKINCKVTSDKQCATNNPAPSDTIIQIVLPYSTVSLSITPSGNPVCQGTLVNFTTTPVNGGTAPLYQWKINGLALSGATNSTFGYVPVNGDKVTCVITSNVSCVLVNTVTSNEVTMIVSPLLPVSVNIAASSNPVCQGTVTFNASPVNGGSAAFYQWKVNGVDIGGHTNVFTYSPSNGDQVSCVLNSSVVCVQGNPATSNTVTLTVIPSSPVSVTIAPTTLPLPTCQGSQVTFDATGMNTGANPVYKWIVNGYFVGANTPSYTYIPNNGDLIKCELHSNVTCPTGNPATSNAITMSFSPVLSPGISVSPSANPSCAGTPITFTSISSNAGVTPLYQWKLNGSPVVGATNTTYSYLPLNNDIVSCVLTSGIDCPLTNPVVSNSITMSVLQPQVAAISISTPTNSVCSGLPVTFSATFVNPGSTPQIQWIKNGVEIFGAISSNYTYIPANGDVISCRLISSVSCITNNPVMSNQVTMVVSDDFPVSITIQPSANPSCVGETVTFTATSVNSGLDPVYQWMVNGFNVGGNSPTFTYSPASGQVVTCLLKSGYICEPDPAMSNAVTMIVKTIQPAGVSIACSSNPACLGSLVTFTATTTNGGSLPLYQWMLNGTPINGATNATYTYQPADDDVVKCMLLSNESCVSNNPAFSEEVTMIVSTSFAAEVIVTSTGNIVCVFTPITFTATPVYGGPSPTYQWQVNGDDVEGATSTTFLFNSPVNGDVVTCVMTSTLSLCTANPVTSIPIVMTVIQIPVSVLIEASPQTAVCQGTPVDFTAYQTNGGPSPTYQWKIGSTIVDGATNPTYSYPPAPGDEVTCLLMSNATCSSGNLATSNIIIPPVNVNLPVSITVNSDHGIEVCEGTLVNYTATPVNEGIMPEYQWKRNGSDITGATNASLDYTPLNGDVITCVLGSNATCATGSPATSNALAMTVNPLMPVGISVLPSANNVCAGTSVTLIATAINGGPAPGYQWRVNGLDVSDATNSTYTYIPLNNDLVTCLLTADVTCPVPSPAVSNTVVMVVNPLAPVSITISPSAGTVCAGSTVTFTSSDLNGGATPGYQWRVNGGNSPGATNATFSYIPVDNDQVDCIITSSTTCSTGSPAVSNQVTITVNPLMPVSVVIAASANPVCQASAVTFNASETNGGGGPGFQWQKNGLNIPGATDITYSYTPVNNDAISCIVTSNATCPSGSPANSNTVVMTVNALQPVSISITATANPVCEGTSVVFNASELNGGTIPQYQWNLNGNDEPGQTNSTYTITPDNNDVVKCRLVSNITCPSGSPAVSNAVTMTVNPLLPVSISILPNATTVCAGTPVTFTSSEFNGGAIPLYQWRVDGGNYPGATNATFSYTPPDNGIVDCIITSIATCATGSPATSNQVAITVNPLLPVSVTIAASANPVCQGSAVTFNASETNGGGGPGFQWQKNGLNIPGATDITYSYTPANNDAISCIVTSNATCPLGSPASSNTVVMTVNALQPVSISVMPTANPVCSGTSVTFNATDVNGGTGPLYQWYLNGLIQSGETNSNYTFIPQSNDIVTCTLVSNITCPSGSPAVSNAVTMTVNPLLPVSLSILPSATTVCAGTAVSFTSTELNGGATPLYQWRVGGIDYPAATSATFTYNPLNNDLVDCIITSNATCATGSPATSNQVTITVNPLMPVSVMVAASANPVCDGSAVTLTANPVNGGGGPGFQWQKSSTNIPGATDISYSYIPANNDAISCIVTSDATCATGSPANSNTVVVIVNPLQPVGISITSTANPVCAGTNVTFNAAPVNGGASPQFLWTVNGTNVAAGTNATYTYIPVQNDLVECTLVSNITCPSGSPAVSNTVAMAVNPTVPVSVSVTASANPVCAGTLVTYTASPVNGGTGPSFAWRVNNFLITGATNNTYTYAPLDDDAITCELTSDAVCPSGNPAVSAPFTANIGSPVVTYSVCHDIETATNARPFKLRGGLPLGGVYSGAGVNSTTGIFDPQAAGPGMIPVTYTYTTSTNCVVSSSPVIINNHPQVPVNCAAANASITDIRDGRLYPVVQIGTQCWLGQNLNFGALRNAAVKQLDNCVNEKYCPADLETNCTLYGALYQWDEMMQHDPSNGGQGLCPPGWHVPNDAEWLILFNFYNGQSEAGTALKDQAPGSFHAIPGGVSYQNGTASFFNPAGFSATFFWTSDAIGQWKAKSHGLNSAVGSVSDYQSGRENAFSVRCIMD